MYLTDGVEETKNMTSEVGCSAKHGAVMISIASAAGVQMRNDEKRCRFYERIVGEL